MSFAASIGLKDKDTPETRKVRRFLIDLLGGSKDRVTNKEYLAQRLGQQKLDEKANAAESISDDKPSGSTVSVDDKPAKPSKYETDKVKLRRVILMYNYGHTDAEP